MAISGKGEGRRRARRDRPFVSRGSRPGDLAQRAFDVEFLVDIGDLAGGAKTVHADEPAFEADVALSQRVPGVLNDAGHSGWV
jgi:hypothetical protein